MALSVYNQGDKMKVWELIAWLKEQNQMAEVEIEWDAENGKDIPFTKDCIMSYNNKYGLKVYIAARND